jgi:hypothetical protein
MRRFVLATTSLVMAFMFVGDFGGSAYAKKSPDIICKRLNGTLSANGTQGGSGTISGCSGNTGGSGVFSSDFFFTNVTVTWANSLTTSFTLNNQRLSKTNRCPTTGPMSSEQQGKGVVTRDDTHSTAVGATVKLKICSEMAVDVDQISMPSGGRFRL